ncbi:MAG: hypothetical protein QG567_2331 [Campylobacterota bacterium]|nr:hypothetical protein [Campylobacterota bacterium]
MLLGSGNLFNKLPLTQTGGVINNTNWLNPSISMIGFDSFDNKSSLPNGYGGKAFYIPMKAGGISSSIFNISDVLANGNNASDLTVATSLATLSGTVGLSGDVYSIATINGLIFATAQLDGSVTVLATVSAGVVSVLNGIGGIVTLSTVNGEVVGAVSGVGSSDVLLTINADMVGIFGSSGSASATSTTVNLFVNANGNAVIDISSDLEATATMRADGFMVGSTLGSEIDFSIVIRAAYAGIVAIDVEGGVAGTAVGIGTHSTPSNNIKDAITIANSLGIEVFVVHGELILGSDAVVPELVFRGENTISTFLVVEAGANVAGCQFQDLILTDSILDGYTYVKHCSIRNISNFYGFMENVLMSQNISFISNTTSYFIDCYSGCVGLGTTDLPTVDMTGADLHIAFRNWAGPIKILNSTDLLNTMCIDVASGATVILDSTCTAGTIFIRGIVDIQNFSAMTIVVIDALTPSGLSEIADAVWSKELP